MNRPAQPSRPTVVLAVMCAGMFLVQLDVTVVNVALPAIGRGFGVGVDGQQWVADGYTIVLAALLLAGGTVGERWGYRRVVLAGFGLFGLASVAAALAPTLGVLVGARIAQGVGAALLLPGTLAVVTEAYPWPERRARALGMWVGISALALPAGPVLGGMLAAIAGWPAVFWVNLPVVAVAIIGTIAVVPAGSARFAGTAGLAGAGSVGVRRPVRPRRFDVAGVVSSAIALGALVVVVIELGRGAGVTVEVAVGLGVAALATAGFVLSPRWVAEPMIPPALARRPAFGGATVVAAAMNFVGLGAIFVFTQYLQGFLRYGPALAGASMLPMLVPLVVLGPLSGRVTARCGPRWPAVVGLLVGAASLGIVVWSPVEAGYLALLPTLLGLGIGMGALTTAVVSAAVSAVPADRAGLASGVNNTARQAGGAIGIATLGAIAGDPTGTAFVGGLRVAAIVGAALWGIAALIAWRSFSGSVGRSVSGPAMPAEKSDV